MLRIPADVHTRSLAQARKARRSLHSEIVHGPEAERADSPINTASP